jgi:drug/metabolite transporter (DMT)-like permease
VRVNRPAMTGGAVATIARRLPGPPLQWGTVSRPAQPRPAARGIFVSGLLLAATASVLFSAKAVVIKLAYRHGVDPATLLALRMLFAAPFFLVALVWSSRGRAPLTLRDHARLVTIGLVGYYGASYFDFLGLQYVSAGLERLILYLYPTIVVVISALFLSRRFTRTDAMALTVAYFGIFAAFWHDAQGGNDVLLGSALIFGSAVTYALYLIISGEMVHRVGAIRLTSYAILVSAVAAVVQFLLLNPPGAIVQPAPVYWLSAVNGFFCTVLPAFATMLAIERIGAGSTSLVAMIGPVATIVLAWALLGEAMSAWGIAGTLLVLAGVFILSRKPVDQS